MDEEQKPEPEASEPEKAEQTDLFNPREQPTTDIPAVETEPPPATSASGTFYDRHKTAVLVAGAAVAAVVLFCAGAAAAHGFHHNDDRRRPGPHPAPFGDNGRRGGKDMGPGAHLSKINGSIKSIDGSNLVINSNDGASTTVKTNDKTVITLSNSATLADIAVGDHLSVAGSRTDNAVNASSIRDLGKTVQEDAVPMRPPIAGRGGAPDLNVGTVTKIENGTLTMTASDGSALTVTTSATTTIMVTKSAKLSDLKVGQSVIVLGGADGNGVVTATQITDSQSLVRGKPNGTMNSRRVS